MKDITFKQVLQYLRELTIDVDDRFFVHVILEAKMSGKEIYSTPILTGSNCSFLEKSGLTYKFREDIQEWEINLIDDEN